MVTSILANDKVSMGVVSSIAIDVVNFCFRWKFDLNSLFDQSAMRSSISVSNVFRFRIFTAEADICTFNRAVASAITGSANNLFCDFTDWACQSDSSHAVHPPEMNVWSGPTGSMNFLRAAPILAWE